MTVTIERGDTLNVSENQIECVGYDKTYKHKGEKMKIKIEKKPKWQKKINFYIDFSERKNPDPIIQGITISIPYYYIFISR